MIMATWVSLNSCRHEPADSPTPSGSDTTGSDTTGNNTGKPCDPDSAYFENNVVPIINSNCALSGCHGNGSSQNGVDLSSYNRIMATADVRPGNPGGSDLFEVITDSDPDKRMPPPPADALTADQIKTIETWISQGARNNSCESCDTTNVTFSGTVNPIITDYCVGCHGGSAPQGGVVIKDYSDIKRLADNGSLLGVIEHQSGYVPMPYVQEPLDPCLIDQIRIWIADGALRN